MENAEDWAKGIGLVVIGPIVTLVLFSTGLSVSIGGVMTFLYFLLLAVTWRFDHPYLALVMPLLGFMTIFPKILEIG